MIQKLLCRSLPGEMHGTLTGFMARHSQRLLTCLKQVFV